jgi:hypothetical protein
MNQAKGRFARRSKRGSALIIAIGFILPLLIAGGALLVQVTHERVATEQAIVIERARDAAASGGQDALAKLSDDPNYEGEYDLKLGGAFADVEVVSWADDDVDNDASGKIDDDDERLFVGITSIGTMNVSANADEKELGTATRKGRSIAEAIVKKVELNLAVNQAVYIDDPLAGFKFSGSQFLISGNDTNIDGSVGPMGPISGIGTPGNPANIISQLSKTQKDCVVGSGGPPSVGAVADVDLPTMFDGLASLASVTWSAKESSYSGDIGDLPNKKPVIAHAQGDLHLNGDTKGCGILCVEGNLVVNGSFDFVGLLFVKGAVTFNGGGGNKDLRGALLTLGEVTGTDVSINGTVQLRYSSEAITLINQTLAGGVALFSWKQR